MLTSQSWLVKACLWTSALVVVALVSQFASMTYHTTAPVTAAGPKYSLDHIKAVAAKLDPDLMAALPDTFLPDYKTPCWYRQRDAGQRGSHMGPAGSSQLLSAHSGQQQLAGQQQLQDLQCLPYFHIMGSFQSGAFSLYNMVNQHPAVAKGHNPRPHFWAEYDKTFHVYMSELQGAMPFVQQSPQTAILGDASESTFAFYMSAGMRGHRIWQQTVQPCMARCEQQQVDWKQHCMDVCWWNATNADAKRALELGVEHRWELDTPLLMKAAYSRSHHAAAIPKLIVLLRNPEQRLLSAFLEYGHYKAKYGDSASGFLAFVKDQLSAFQACVDKYSSLEECTLLFESLDYTNEQAYFHCDQVLRGLYWMYLAGWQQHFGPDQLLVLFSEELFEAPERVLQRVVRFLGLSEGAAEAAGGAKSNLQTTAAGAPMAASETAVWSAMLQAGGHRQSLTAQLNYYDMVPEAKHLVQHFYESHNRRLGQMLMGKDSNPWNHMQQTIRAMYNMV